MCHKLAYPVLVALVFFINDNLLYKIRHDLSESVAGLETFWIELPVKLNHNLIVGVIYRHPHSDLSAFMSSLNNNLDKINNEQKYCVLMGDFNLNMLNSDSHLPTDEFLNSLGTYFYNPIYFNIPVLLLILSL